MKSSLVYRWSTAALLAAAVLATGCASNNDGPDAPAKQSWDEPQSEAEMSALRDRLATTQRDN